MPKTAAQGYVHGAAVGFEPADALAHLSSKQAAEAKITLSKKRFSETERISEKSQLKVQIRKNSHFLKPDFLPF